MSGTCWDTFHFRVHISLLLYHHFYDYEMLKNSSIVFFTSNAETNCIGELMALFFWHTTSTSLYNYLHPLETHSNFCFRIQWILGYWISTTLRLTRWNPEEKIWQILTGWFNFHGSRRWMKALFGTLFSIPSAKSCWATTTIWLNLTPSGSLIILISWIKDNRSKLSSFCFELHDLIPNFLGFIRSSWTFFCNGWCMHFEEFSLTPKTAMKLDTWNTFNIWRIEPPYIIHFFAKFLVG